MSREGAAAGTRQAQAMSMSRAGGPRRFRLRLGEEVQSGMERARRRVLVNGVAGSMNSGAGDRSPIPATRGKGGKPTARSTFFPLQDRADMPQRAGAPWPCSVHNDEVSQQEPAFVAAQVTTRRMISIRRSAHIQRVIALRLAMNRDATQ